MSNGILGTLIGTKTKELKNATMEKAKRTAGSLMSKFVSTFTGDNESDRPASKKKDDDLGSSIKDLLSSINKNTSTTANIIGKISSGFSKNTDKLAGTNASGASFSAEPQNKVDIPQDQQQDDVPDTENADKGKIESANGIESEASAPQTAQAEKGNEEIQSTGYDDSSKRNEIDQSIIDIGTKIVNGIDNINKYLSNVESPSRKAQITGEVSGEKNTEGKSSTQNQIVPEQNSLTGIDKNNSVESSDSTQDKSGDNSRKSGIVGSIMSTMSRITDPFGIRKRLIETVERRFSDKQENPETAQIKQEPIADAGKSEGYEQGNSTNDATENNEGGVGGSGILGSITSKLQRLFDPFGIRNKITNGIKNQFSEIKKDGAMGLLRKSPPFVLFSMLRKMTGSGSDVKAGEPNDSTSDISKQINPDGQPGSIGAETDSDQTDEPIQEQNQQATPNSSVEINNFNSKNNQEITNSYTSNTDRDQVDTSAIAEKATIVPNIQKETTEKGTATINGGQIGDAVQQSSTAPTVAEAEDKENPPTEHVSDKNGEIKIDAGSVKVVSSMADQDAALKNNQSSSFIPSIDTSTINADSTASLPKDESGSESSSPSKINPFTKATDGMYGLFSKVRNLFNPISKDSDNKPSLLGKIGGMLNPISAGINLISKLDNPFRTSNEAESKAESVSSDIQEPSTTFGQNNPENTPEPESNDIVGGYSTINNAEQDVKPGVSLDEVVSGLGEACGKLGSIEELLTKLFDGMSKPIEPPPDSTDDESSFDGASVI